MKRALARRLAALDGFQDPDVESEQYPSSPELAASLIHLADLESDLDELVVDLGAGTGLLALAAATRDPKQIVGVEQDWSALDIARLNETTIAADTTVDWVQADATRIPLGCSDATVVMNPPFGAQHGRRGADRDFLDTARAIGVVTYSIHNAGSRDFIEAYAADHGGDVTHAFAAELPVDAQFDFHASDRANIPVEVFRVEWPDYT